MSHDLKLKTIVEMESIPLEDLREDMDAPPAIHQNANVLSHDFIEFMKNAENAGRTGFSNGVWTPHKSYEGGNPTIAWGHKIKNKAEWNKYSQGITEREAEKLLKDDILEASRKVKAYMDSLHVRIPLDQRQSEMLTEFMFNLGNLRSFPKFVRAVLDKDWKTAKKECVRHANGKPIDRRNNLFIQRYF